MLEKIHTQHEFYCNAEDMLHEAQEGNKLYKQMYLDNIDYVSKICKAFHLNRLEDWEEGQKLLNYKRGVGVNTLGSTGQGWSCLKYKASVHRQFYDIYMKMSVTAAEEGKTKDANQLEQEMKSPLGELKAQALTHIKNKDFGEKSLLCPSLLFLSILKVEV